MGYNGNNHGVGTVFVPTPTGNGQEGLAASNAVKDAGSSMWDTVSSWFGGSEPVDEKKVIADRVANVPAGNYSGPASDQQAGLALSGGNQLLANQFFKTKIDGRTNMNLTNKQIMDNLIAKKTNMTDQAYIDSLKIASLDDWNRRVGLKQFSPTNAYAMSVRDGLINQAVVK